jgi:hypothetical protein
MIEKENEHLRHFLTWYCTLQGFLLAALSFDLPQSKGGHDLVVCGFGVAIASFVFHPMYYAHRTMMKLLDWWDEHRPKDYAGPDVIGLRPPNQFARYIGHSHMLPLMFFIASCMLLAWRVRGTSGI